MTAIICRVAARHSNGRVVVVGQGYVGLPVAVRAVEVGYEVVSFDLDELRVKGLSDGVSFVEDISDARLGDALAAGRFHPSSNPEACAGFDVAVISVPTPLREGAPDLSYIEAAAATLACHLRRGACVILESTTYPGTTEELVAPILEAGSDLAAGVDFHLGYGPERIDLGNKQWTFERTPKVIPTPWPPSSPSSVASSKPPSRSPARRRQPWVSLGRDPLAGSGPRLR